MLLEKPMNPEFAELARYVRETRLARGMGQDDIRARGGPSKGWVGALEAGTMADRPKPDTLQRLASALGVEDAVLMRLAGYGYLPKAQVQIIHAGEAPPGYPVNREPQRPIPYYGRVGCGDFLEICETPLGERQVATRLVDETVIDRLGTVEAVGDSMNLVPIYPGMTMLVRCQNTANHGQIVLADVPFAGTTCKRLVREDGKAWLVAESTGTHPRIEVVEGVTITGVVVAVWYEKVFE